MKYNKNQYASFFAGRQASSPQVHHQGPLKVLCLHGAVDNVEMGEEELFQNTHLSLNFLVSLLKKHKKHIEKFTKTD